MKVKMNTVLDEPKQNEDLICFCPNWNEIGYQIARYEDGEFTYPEQPNNWFHENVIGWAYLHPQN